MTESAELPMADRPGGSGEGGGGRGTTYDDRSDREALSELITDLREHLREVINETDWLPTDSIGSYQVAFTEIQGDFNLVLAQLAEPAIDDYLAVAGLTGVQRRLKTGLHDLARKASPALQATKIALKAANHILGSLLALPGVEKIKEFKETVETGLDVAEYLVEPAEDTT
jgi:hypothetical protein